jgi:hypothetical protein
MDNSKLKPLIGFTFAILLSFYSCAGINSNVAGLNRIYRIAFIQPSDTSKLSKEEKNDLKSLKKSLDVAGFRYKEVSVERIGSDKFSNYDIAILPFAAAKELKPDGIKALKDAVESGLKLLFDGITDINDALGIQILQKNIVISKIRDMQYPDDVLYWTQQSAVNPIDNSSKQHEILCIDDSTKLPIVVSGNFGKGKYICYSTLFDPNTDKGYSRFPFLIESLENVFGLNRLAERRHVEMYFDPGMRYLDTIKIDNLAKQWKALKIKRIYAAGWYYDDKYDYKHLLKVCHENGILVYCWLETPMISEKFWNNHPEWREKTAYLKDAQIDWRFLMNLANADCRKQVFAELKDFLVNNDWDGVDFAEMYFEPSPVGPELPENFTPMNDIVREDFKKQSGFDPVLLFDTKSPHYWKINSADWHKFADYRKQLCYQLKTYFLDYLSEIKIQKKDFEVMLTVIDVSITPEVSDNIGEDTENTLKCYKNYDIVLQEEDPSSCWGLTPERYDMMGKLYRKRVKEKNKLIFDCNVVSSHEKGYGGFPSEKPSGEEIRQITYNMDLHNARPAFYSEDALFPRDFVNINTVLARDVRIDEKLDGKWIVSTPYTALVKLGAKNISVKMDKFDWYAIDGDYVIIPEGKHELEFFTSAKDSNRLKLISISGELKGAKFSDNSVELDYSEEYVPCYISINKKPESIYIDSKRADCSIYSNEGIYTIKLPAGRHKVRIE